MTIDRITINENPILLKRPFVTSLRRVDVVESIIVRVETDDGLIGYGETAPTEAITGQSHESILEGLGVLKEGLTGADLAEFDGTIARLHAMLPDNPNACSAMEIALYDLRAQWAGVPLVEYLGGKVQSLETGITISLGSVESMVTQVHQALDEGYASLKIKLGDDPHADLERIEAIHSAVLGRAHLKLDANQGWSADETIKFLTEMEERGIEVELIEQPLPRADLAGLARVRKHTSVPILVDESVFTLEDTVRVLEAGAADLINIKLDKCGGISQAIKIADLCAEAEIQCMMGCMLEGAVSVGAAAHVAAARPDTITLYDLDAPLLCREEPVIGGVVFGVPEITIPRRAGLGIERILGVDWDR
jgi:o-succinylbenzoate synthase